MTITQPELLPRFDPMTRAVHWITAAAGGVVLSTATVLYVPELSAAVGRRAALMEAHVVAGLFLPVPLIFGASVGPSGVRLRRDLRELWSWTPTDRRWWRPKHRETPVGKFNGGQKLVTALFAGLFVMQLLTGSLMYWHDPFSPAWRTGATFVHDWAYLALFATVLGHVAKALQEPELMRSMTSGSVPAQWARRERPTWHASDDAVEPAIPAPTGTGDRRLTMLARLVGGVLLLVVGVVWILQGLDIASGSGMSGHAIWAVFGVILVGLGVLLLRAANTARSARS
ncbi:MAG: formate dehydrogenase [Acidimicrobiia bacterium]|nr:formate dehydrogenase [Acidimicrobiia bacterium]